MGGACSVHAQQHPHQMVLAEHAIALVPGVPDPVDACQIHQALSSSPMALNQTADLFCLCSHPGCMGFA